VFNKKYSSVFFLNKSSQCVQHTVFLSIWRFTYTKYWEILYVEHCGKMYLHKITRNTLCWTLWEYLFTQNTGDDFMLSTVEKFIYTKYWWLLYVEHCGKIYLHTILGNTLCWAQWEYWFTHNTGDYFMLSTVGIFIYTRYRGLHYVEHCRQDLFTPTVFNSTRSNPQYFV
jgi:hypothetical protein